MGAALCVSNDPSVVSGSAPSSPPAPPSPAVGSPQLSAANSIFRHPSLDGAVAFLRARAAERAAAEDAAAEAAAARWPSPRAAAEDSDDEWDVPVPQAPARRQTRGESSESDLSTQMDVREVRIDSARPFSFALSPYLTMATPGVPPARAWGTPIGARPAVLPTGPGGVPPRAPITVLPERRRSGSGSTASGGGSSGGGGSYGSPAMVPPARGGIASLQRAAARALLLSPLSLDASQGVEPPPLSVELPLPMSVK